MVVEQSMADENSYLTYSNYLSSKYGGKVYRVGVDAGFSCPNRKSGRISKGCAFCDEYGARAVYIRNENSENPEIDKELNLSCSLPDFPEAYSREGVEMQIKRGAEFLRKRYGAQDFILYFQAFSNTYSEPHILEKIYTHALSCMDFKEFVVSTRPDCLSEETADVLASMKSYTDEVWVELGLQSADNKVLERVNRGHSYEDFEVTYNSLKNRGIKVAVHLITGLPGEDQASFQSTVEKVASLRPDGLKIHNLHIVKNTDLANEYLRGAEFGAPSMRRHLQNVIYTIERMPPETVIMRVTCDTPASRLIAPDMDIKKVAFVQQLRAQMQLQKTYQGRLFKSDPEC
jgi:radical SAM protein (TIGR01212 family)